MCRDAARHAAFPAVVEADLQIQPALQPARLGQARLHGIVGEQGLVHVQVGGVHGLRRAAGRGHQHADLGERLARVDTGGVAAVVQRAAHVLQVGPRMARLVLRDGLVDGLDDGLGVPSRPRSGTSGSGAPRRRSAASAFPARGPGRTRSAPCAALPRWAPGRGWKRRKYSISTRECFCSLEEPHRHKGAEIAVAAIVAQEHLGGQQRRHSVMAFILIVLGLVVRQLAARRSRPRDVRRHVPAHGFHSLEEFGIKHGGPLSWVGARRCCRRAAYIWNRVSRISPLPRVRAAGARLFFKR